LLANGVAAYAVWHSARVGPVLPVAPQGVKVNVSNSYAPTALAGSAERFAPVRPRVRDVITLSANRHLVGLKTLLPNTSTSKDDKRVCLRQLNSMKLRALEKMSGKPYTLEKSR
jgi:hypothetical protein